MDFKTGYEEIESIRSQTRDSTYLTLIDWLSAFHRLNKHGLGLIIKYRDPNNRRRQVLQLSPKGRKLVQELKQMLYPEN